MKDTSAKPPTRFERRLKKAMNPRCRKYKRRLAPTPVESSAATRTHLQAVLEDLRSGDLAGSHHDPYIYGGSASAKSGIDDVGAVVKGAAFVAGAAVADTVDSLKNALKSRKRKGQEKENRLRLEQNRAMRRKYYEKEAERRRLEAEQIRAATPPPANPMPTPEALIHAYVYRNVSEEAAIRFGSLIIDLEEHVHWTVRNEHGRIVGGSGGVREWLKKNCPELAAHYHTCQRFKRKAQPDE